ncbi:spore germination protein [Paenibacillus sp. SN-8-1]|uniref:spore germination protein n=1 Tax=Paenibacillus sp. SN-8-1 TaxID=3435409 RepID=UPI003D9A613C
MNELNELNELKKSPIVLNGILQHDLDLFKSALERCSDVVYRMITLHADTKGTLIFIDGMVDDARNESTVIEPLLQVLSGNNDLSISDNLSTALDTVFADQLEKGDSLDQAVKAICKGDTALILDGFRDFYLISNRKWEQRSIEEPAAEPVIRGPRDGFTENLRVNTTLIRRRLATPDLKVEAFQVGELSRTDIALVYLDSIVMKGLVEEIKERLNRIKIEAILESGYIEELITDNTFSVFPQLISTERPDRVVSGLLEGKAAIIIDNTPFSLIAPGTFADSLQASEDYYQNYIASTLTRLLRLWLAFSALVFPSVYIAVTTFHQEMVPTSLLLSIASSREAVPFPGIVEAFLMEAAFEGLREAGIRLPKPVGQAVSIVGALVIGQAAVQAGIVSAILVIVVSFTGIASFIFPIYSQGLAFRVLRFPMMFLAGMLGLYGVFLGLLVIAIHLAKLRSFGVPYMSPIAPLSMSGLQDIFVRLPWWDRVSRPLQTGKANRSRMSPHLRPRPPKN